MPGPHSLSLSPSLSLTHTTLLEKCVFILLVGVRVPCRYTLCELLHIAVADCNKNNRRFFALL
jgi:hypothetical protein